MKHAFVDETLTKSEREAPFRLAGPDPEEFRGPTRLPCVVSETGDGVVVVEFQSIREAIEAEQSLRMAAE